LLNSIDTASTTVRAISSYEILWYALDDLAASGCVFVHRCTVLLIALCLTFCLLSTGHAQEPANTDLAAAPASLSSGWWSPDKAASTMAPHLELNVADLNHFAAVALPVAAAPTPTQQSPTQISNFLSNSGSFELTSDQQSAEWAALAQGQTLPPDSLLGLVTSKYATWERNLGETRTPINVNGQSVYPLAEITFGGWTVPIGLYISPLRGGGSR
jgi:hypothetical protein